MTNVLFIDVDGTLITTKDGKQYLPPSAVDAMRQVRARGGRIYLCTGRSLAEARTIGEVPIDGRVQEFYNEDEISHMTDVRVLFVLCIRLRFAAAALCLGLAFYIIRGTHRDWVYVLSRGFVRVCGVILLAVLALGLLISTNFSKYFVVFHEIFFSQGNWMFDVTKSRMIDIMPEEFFSDIAGLIAVTFLVSVVILLVLAILAERKVKPSGRRGQA